VWDRGSNRVAWAVGPGMLGPSLLGRSDTGRFVGSRVRNKFGGLLGFLLPGRVEGGRYVGIGVWDEFDGPLGARNLYAIWLGVDGELMYWIKFA
jgi:hypothetical protein